MIRIKLDYDGNPYLEVMTKEDYGKENIENEAIEVFIRKARENGIIIKNESSFDTSNDYATIRINKKGREK